MPFKLNDRKHNYFITGLIVPVVLFAIYLFHHAVNMPYMDDAEIVDSINLIQKKPSDLFSILIRQQNDHRVTFSRLGMLFIYLVKGSIDFRLAIFLGFFNLILLVYCFFLIYKSENLPGFSFLPVVILSFSPLVYADHLWSITSFQYTLSVAFSILALYFLRPELKKIWYWSLPFMVAASLTNLDGLSVLPVGVFWLVCQKRWYVAGLIALFSAVYLAAFFTNFTFSSASELAFTAESLFVIAHSFLAIAGSFTKLVSDSYGVMFSTIAGSVIVAGFVILKLLAISRSTANGLVFRNPFDLDYTDINLLKLFASLAMISIGRSGEGAEAMMGVRFQVYSLSTIVLFYFFMLKTFKNLGSQRWSMITCVGSFLIAGYSYAKYESVVNFYTSGLKADSYNYTHNGVYLHQYLNHPDPDTAFYSNYSFPVFFSEKLIEGWRINAQRRAPSATMTIKEVENIHEYRVYLTNVLEFEIHTDAPEIPKSGVYLMISSVSEPANIFLIATREVRGSWITRSFTESGAREFAMHIPKKIAQGIYSARLCWQENGEPRSTMVAERFSI
ncbi:hypothetical protein [Dyadobacter sp. 32]|uniref:hypothetical protein n=1 Tax=Dyadobacter sp. 32 TaxID=538966 RepID=UPI0011EDB73B